MGLSGAVPNLFSSMSGVLVPYLYKEYGLGVCLSVSAGLCLFSTVMCMVMIYLQRKADVHDFRLKLLIMHKERNLDSVFDRLNGTDMSVVPKNDSFKLSKIKEFQSGFWIFVVDCMLTYGMTQSSIALGSTSLIDKYGWQDHQASMIITLPYTISVVAMPLIGLFVDKFGKRMTIILIAGILNLMAHVYSLVHPDCHQCWSSVVPYVIYGLTNSVYNCIMFGAVVFLCKPYLTGTAFGVLACFQNIGTGIFPLIVSPIVDKTGGYSYMDLTFIGVSLLSICLKLLVNSWDSRKRGGLLDLRDVASRFEGYNNKN